MTAGRARGFSLPSSVSAIPQAHYAYFPICTGGTFAGSKVDSVKLTAHLHSPQQHSNKAHEQQDDNVDKIYFTMV